MALGRTNITLTEISVKPKELMLYNYGDECTDITGGWSVYAAGPYTGTSELQDERMYFTQTRWYRAGFSTANKIDMTDYTTIKVLYSLTQGNSTKGRMYFNVDDSKDTETYSSSYPAYPAPLTAEAQTTTQTSGTEIVLELDITNVTGEKYPLVIPGGSNESNMTVSVYKVWLE